MIKLFRKKKFLGVCLWTLCLESIRSSVFFCITLRPHFSWNSMNLYGSGLKWALIPPSSLPCWQITLGACKRSQRSDFLDMCSILPLQTPCVFELREVVLAGAMRLMNHLTEKISQRESGWLERYKLRRSMDLILIQQNWNLRALVFTLGLLNA